MVERDEELVVGGAEWWRSEGAVAERGRDVEGESELPRVPARLPLARAFNKAAVQRLMPMRLSIYLT